MIAFQWLEKAQQTMSRIGATQTEPICRAAEWMADSIQAERWVHTFGCGHATLPVEEMYPRIGSFVGFHPIIETPLSYFTHIVGDMGVNQFVFLERVEGYGTEIMKSHALDRRDTLWIFSHSGLNQVNIDVALEARRQGLKVVATGSAAAFAEAKARHSSGYKLFELADAVIDTCVPAEDAAQELPGVPEKIGPLSTVGFVAVVWMTVATIAEILTARGVPLYIHPSHNAPGKGTPKERLEAALEEYKRRIFPA